MSSRETFYKSQCSHAGFSDYFEAIGPRLVAYTSISYFTIPQVLGSSSGLDFDTGRSRLITAFPWNLHKVPTWGSSRQNCLITSSAPPR